MRIQQATGYPALQVNVDRTRAQQFGITEKDVTNNLGTSLAGSVSGLAAVLAEPGHRHVLRRGGGDAPVSPGHPAHDRSTAAGFR